jgi:hypothetical protein
MDALPVARALSAGRLALGVAMVLAPRVSIAPWIGTDAHGRGTQVAVRAFGAREAFLGFLGLHVADHPGVGPRTIRAYGALDAFDATLSVASRRALPASGVALIAAVAGGSAVAHLWAARKLPPA